MKKLLVCIFLFIMIASFGCTEPILTAHANSEEVEFVIVDENEDYINSGYNCLVGDLFISEDNIMYEIYFVDHELSIAYAREKTIVELPKVDSDPTSIVPVSTYQKRIGMYHTHNDESYVIGDGYDSVYGEGGIMDIGDAFARELKKYNITVYQNDTLHLPHDSKAYTRSKKTAQSLLSSVSLDAIFDVHRDGVPRKQFIGEVNGKTTSKIRMVIGKSNPNYNINLNFALAIKAYADEKYPGLIKDIYIGNGNYNQNLYKTALLFEMGTYLIEKDYVFSSLPYLADTIDKVMYTNAVESPETNSSFGENILDLNGNDLTSSVENIDGDDGYKNAMIVFFVTIVGGGIAIIVIKNITLLKKKKRKK